MITNTRQSLSFLTLSIALAALPSLFAQEDGPPGAGRWQARSMVETKFGIVATSQTLASAAGAHVLEMGGNAIDAAIAANAVLGVVEADVGQRIGGDTFSPSSYEGQNRQALRPERQRPGRPPASPSKPSVASTSTTKCRRPASIRFTVPGAVAGWDMLRAKFGTMPLDRILTPAIYYAENGFPVTEIIGAGWQERQTRKLSATARPQKIRIFPTACAPKVGEVFPAIATWPVLCA